MSNWSSRYTSLNQFNVFPRFEPIHVQSEFFPQSHVRIDVGFVNEIGIHAKFEARNDVDAA